ncbi:MAG: hypothetical protein FJX72_06200 [Armatimonadetes bacterium]|nr:hypothetical protein [Armatimonadota bacterium]
MKEVFPIIPGSSGPIWLLVGMAAFFGLMLAAFGWFAWSSRNASVEVSAEGVRVRGAMYGRTIPLQRLQPEGATTIQVATGDHRLVTRTNGAGLPGYLAGWFRAADGEKVLAFVTDKRRVAYLPTNDGYALMVSTPDPEALIEAVQRATRR